MSEDPRALLVAGLRELRIHNPAAVADKLFDYGTLILDENTRTNLTGARDMRALIGAQFLDSLAPLGLITLDELIIDVGSGSGFPGIPAAIAHPDKKFVLLEPRAKRAAFLESASVHLALARVSVVKSSALGPGATSLAGMAGTVLMRAIAEPDAAIRLGMPLLRPGGTLLLYEGRSSRPSADQRKVASHLGGGEIAVKRVLVPSLEAVRHAWIVRRTHAKALGLRARSRR